MAVPTRCGLFAGPRLLLPALLALGALAIGCMTINVETVLSPNETVTQEISITASKLRKEAIEAQLRDLSGWEVSEAEEGDQVIFTARRTAAPVHSLEDVSVEVHRRGLTAWEYHWEQTLPPEGFEVAPGEEDAAATISIQYVLRMPGRVQTATKAHFSGDTVEWTLSAADLPVTLEAVSVDSGRAGLIGSALIVLLLVLAVVVPLRAGASRAGGPSAP